MLALLILMASRPVSFGAVFGVTVGLFVFAIVVELLRRPPGAAIVSPREEPLVEEPEEADPADAENARR
ncbi:hypothetical protein LJR042_002145 [Microbacterium maritypicum]|uniref:hypothetical protein n=1 Tax=Microbacterium TaxID=33882 RepID=UPI001422AFC6|nr:hypothetical protein [Microbacterium sp. UBA6741]NIG64716.1 hypothetical protein [Microbacterium sp. Be9]